MPLGDGVGTGDEMRIVIQQAHRAYRIVVCGEVDLSSAPALHDALVAALSRRHSRVELDLGGVTFFSCAGLSVLARARNTAGDRLVLVNAATPVRRVLDILGLRSAFAPYSAVGFTMRSRLHSRQ